jgi:hypothetical protein
MVHTIEEYLHYFIEEVGGVTMTPMEFRSGLQTQAVSQMRALQEVPAQ